MSDKEMEIMDVKEASEYLKIKPPTLYKYLKEGIIPAFKVGNFWRLEKSILNEWVRKKIQENHIAGWISVETDEAS